MLRPTLAFILLTAVSCGDPNLGPVETVKSPDFSLQYPPEWWRDAARQDAEAFKKARAFCESKALPDGNFDSTRYPNCEHLRSAVAIEKAREAIKDPPEFEGFGPEITR